MKVTLRATAWWIVLVATSLVVLAQTYPVGESGGYGGGGSMSGFPTLADDGDSTEVGNGYSPYLYMVKHQFN